MSSRILTEREVAERFGLHRQTLRKMRAKGVGPAYVRLSAGRIGYLEDDTEDFIKARRVATRLPDARPHRRHETDHTDDAA